MEKPVFNLNLIQKYNISGPRYTSYPTALEFSDFDDTDYRDAINASSRKDRDLSLYFHLPFCDTICYYCACNKIVTKDKRRAVPYLEHLHREIDLQAELFGADRYVSQLHWGGGTPTYINDEQMTDLYQHISRSFQLRSDDAGEFSLEIDPRTVSLERISLLRSLGFNRLSMGIQDFDPKVQLAVNRLQSEEQTFQSIVKARDEGFHSISVDLIYGLPHQSVASFTQTLDKIVHMDPDRISIYNYAHLPERFKTQKQIHEEDLPSPEEKLSILELCIEKLGSAGFVYIGMDHFAKPGDELARALENGSLHRNFQGYSTHADCDMVAMGTTAISQIGTSYSQNFRTPEEYYQSIDKERIPVFKGLHITHDDLIRKRVIMSLICQFQLDMNAVSNEFDLVFADYFASELTDLKPLIEDGLVKQDGHIISVTNEGRLLIRNVCMVFDGHMKSPHLKTKFSKVI
jgi:oxygen-independent coproporphyrinogen-3 oxidase